MTNVFSMLSSVFDYTPHFTIEDFFTPNVAVDRKVSFLLTIVALIKSKQADLIQNGYQIGDQETPTLNR